MESQPVLKSGGFWAYMFPDIQLFSAGSCGRLKSQDERSGVFIVDMHGEDVWCICSGGINSLCSYHGNQ